eukprot:3644718-Pyramimonas_sp.AAC.1
MPALAQRSRRTPPAHTTPSSMSTSWPSTLDADIGARASTTRRAVRYYWAPGSRRDTSRISRARRRTSTEGEGPSRSSRARPS